MRLSTFTTTNICFAVNTAAIPFTLPSIETIQTKPKRTTKPEKVFMKKLYLNESNFKVTLKLQPITKWKEELKHKDYLF